MNSTRVSVLEQAAEGSEVAWAKLVDIYRPLVFGWLRHQDMAHHDAEELTQDVMATVVKELPSFSHSGNKGAFRRWLRQITVNRALGFWRAGKYRPTATGESKILNMINEMADDASTLSQRFDREHDQHVLRECLRRIEPELQEVTLIAFRRLVFEGESADRVADELDLSVGAVYSAKSRVLRKLREEIEGLVDPQILE